jgi:hypothetical protein
MILIVLPLMQPRSPPVADRTDQRASCADLPPLRKNSELVGLAVVFMQISVPSGSSRKIGNVIL